MHYLVYIRYLWVEVISSTTTSNTAQETKKMLRYDMVEVEPCLTDHKMERQHAALNHTHIEYKINH